MIPSNRSHWSRLRSTLAASTFAASSALLTSCASGPPVFDTMRGPETASILQPLHGHVAIGEGDLPCNPVVELARKSTDRCLPYVHQRGLTYQAGVLAEGPDALLMMQMQRGTTPGDAFVVSLIRSRCIGPGACKVEQREIASWTTPAGGNLYRKPMALSPDGRWLATVPASRLLKLDGYSPRITFGQRFRDSRTVGELVLVDLQTGQQRHTGVELLDEQPISWSADGRRLLVVRAETTDRLTPRLVADVQGNEGRAGQGIPVVEILSIDGGAIEMLAIGLDPLWSRDQSTLLVKVADDHLELRDLASGASRPIRLPGLTGRFGPIDFVGPRQVLYWALPTDGREPDSTVNNSPLVGPKPMIALKVVDLDTLAFATVVPRIDPRANVGYYARD